MEHSAWLDRLSDQYNRPRVELIALFRVPGALEYEIARFISKAAQTVARSLIENGGRPNQDSADLWDRAVCGHWRTLRDQEIAQSADQLAEVVTLVQQGYIEIEASHS